MLHDGNVLLEGGVDAGGNQLSSAELFNVDAGSFSFASLSSEQAVEKVPFLAASLPVDGAANVPVDSYVGLLFSKRLRVETINADTVTLSGPEGTVQTRVVPAEAGKLAFVTPKGALLPGVSYTISVAGVVDEDGKTITPATVSFTTKKEQGPDGKLHDLDDWVPDETNLHGNWRSKFKESQWQSLPNLQAADGVTAVAGQVLTLSGKPLDKITLKIADRTVQTDNTGRFLLTSIPSGHQVLLIDGRTASRNNEVYGIFRVGVKVIGGKTNPLGFTVWMPKLDTLRAKSIPSPTTAHTVVTNPRIPGLELHLPSGTVIRDTDGQNVTQISITPIPTNQPPFPLPPGVDVPVYFTIQPGSSQVIPPRAQLIYPNFIGSRPGTRIDFWNYDPTERGWYVYGQGSVTPDGRQIVPDPGVVLYEFSGAMVAVPSLGPLFGPLDGSSDGDPVDLGTGLFVLDKTDLILPDTLPINLTRTYRPNDTVSRPFGLGATHPYEIFLVGDTFPYTYVDLIMPDGGRVHYDRISPGTDFTTAVYENSSTPNGFYKSRINWNGNGWDLKLKDGSLYVFPDGMLSLRPSQAALLHVQDRFGNMLSLTRDANENLTKITTPNNRWVEFTYDSSYRITQAKDNIGRIVTYTYDASGRLWKVTDPNNGITEYSYDASHRMLTVKDARGIVYLTNEYDTNGRVTKQTLADNTPGSSTDNPTYQFAYTLDSGGRIVQTDVTDPRGNIRRVTFNSAGYRLTDTSALGRPEQQGVSLERQAGTNLVQAVIDSMGRRSGYGFDSMGNLISLTKLAGTAASITTSFTYESAFNQLTGVTNPLNHTTSFSYDAQGNLIRLTDPVGHETTFTYNANGQPLSVTNALNHTTQFAYDSGDLVAIEDPLGRTMGRFLDGAGRVLSVTNAGNRTRYEFDSLNRLKRVLNPLQGETTFTYDHNSNLLSTTDARGYVTSFTYDNMDRVLTRTDALQGATSVESYEYDPAGNLSKFTDRRAKVTACNYDGLNRRVFVGFGRVGSGETATYESTINYSYDSANRLTQAVDSQAGTITRSLNDQARTFSETTSQGTVSYAFDAAGRRTQMMVSGQQPIAYGYDNVNRLTGISQGPLSANFAYDEANRRTSLLLPNGVAMEYAFDNASQLTSLIYKQGLNVLGDISYSYDPVGRRTKMGGSFARTGQPQPMASATHNAANQLTQHLGQTLTYDANGNLTGDGANTYTWDARNQLASITGSVNASFQYDVFGRRVNKNVDGNSTSFLYDGANVVQELSGTTPVANMLTGGMDQVFNRTDTDGSKSFLTDGLGSVIALTDSAGALTTQYTFEPFGNTTQTGPASDNANQFTSRENDNSGLYYYRARYYSPTLQRFISEDPVGLGGGDTNFYAYTGNDPVNFTDPLGHQMIGVTDGISGAGGAGALSAGGTGSIMSGIVFGDQGIRTGGAVGGGAFAFSSSDGANGSGYGYGQGAAVGASAGGGVGIFISNASSFDQLSGEFWTFQINTQLVSFEYDVSGDTKVLAVTGGRGWGASVVVLKTNTPYTWEGPFHPVLPGAEPLVPLPLLTPGSSRSPNNPNYPYNPNYSYNPYSWFSFLGGRK